MGIGKTWSLKAMLSWDGKNPTDAVSASVFVGTQESYAPFLYRNALIRVSSPKSPVHGDRVAWRQHTRPEHETTMRR